MNVDGRPVVMLHKPRSILHLFCSVSTDGLISHITILAQPGLTAPQLCLNPHSLTMLEF